MRIISGALQRRLVPSPPGTATRPTTDRMRESLFHVLEQHVVLTGAVIVDLYAGSGILTWESLSRGAASAIMVDTSADICRHLRKVSQSLDVEDQVTIIRTTALEYLRTSPLTGASCLFADPPYALRHCNAIVQQIEKTALLSNGGIVVLEHSDREVVLPSSEYSPLWQGTASASIIDMLQRLPSNT
jgi:16S rRNA (guanine966-N2)-methyltransferase